MKFPDFFDSVPVIALFDPLAAFLGAAEQGVLEYRYQDAVRLAGHSCPTLASIWTMLRRGLAALHPEGLPQRGVIRVEFKEAATAGVTGVMASVATLVTGATLDGGFKGLAGRFDRRGLLGFGVEMGGQMRLTRMDTGAGVELAADLSRVPAAPTMGPLMQQCLAGGASPAEAAEFRRLWQERVRAVLLDFGDDDGVFPVRKLE